MITNNTPTKTRDASDVGQDHVDTVRQTGFASNAQECTPVKATPPCEVSFAGNALQKRLIDRENRKRTSRLNVLTEPVLHRLLLDIYPVGDKQGDEFVIGNIQGDGGESMSVNLNGKLGVWHDFATGDSGRGAVSLVRGRYDLDEIEAQKWLSGWLRTQGINSDLGGEQTGPTEARQQTRYSYCDANGVLLVESVRTDWIEDGKPRKKFSMFDPDTESWKRPSGRIPCYNTDVIAQYPDETVVVVEGEKAADALTGIAVLATTSLGGARAPAKTDWNALQQRDVIIWPDNDSAGQNYASEVAKLAKAAGASSIRVIVQDPSWPEKHDAADAIDAGLTIAGFNMLVSASSTIDLSTIGELPKSKRLSDREDGPSPFDVAMEMVRNYPDAKTWNETTWVWTSDLVYKEMSDILFRKHAQKTFAESATASGVKNAVDLFKNHTSVEENPLINLPSRTVFASNGDLIWDGPTFQLVKPTPARFNTVRLPWQYDPGASCPRFLSYLKEVFRDDADKHEKINLIQEIMGYCLVFDASWPIIAIMYGPGANGKSVLIDIIVVLLGDQNVTSVSPKDFKTAFYRHKLVGRLANVVPELDAGERLEDATLKQLSSGDIIAVEQKYKTPTEARVYATNIFASNSLPFSRDLTHGLRRRMRFIPFNRIFEPQEQDPQLKDTIVVNEMPGILAFAIAGLERLYRQNGFTHPPSSIQALEDWAKHVDHVQMFLEDECTIDEGLSVTSGEIFAAYSDWAASHGISKRHDAPRLTTNIKNTHPQIKSARSGQTRRLDGIGLKTLPARISQPSSFRKKLAAKLSGPEEKGK